MSPASRALLWSGLAAVTLVAAAPSRTPRSPLPFRHDDYARALEEARARKAPLFIEAWAPW